VQSIRRECLGHFVVFGPHHLRYLVREYVAHHNAERPHQARGNLPLTGAPPPAPGELPETWQVVCEERLGGLLKHYRRAG
jgi:putative transposase